MGRAHVGVRSEPPIRGRVGGAGPARHSSSRAGGLRESWRVSRARAVGSSSGGQHSSRRADSGADARARHVAVVPASCRRGGSTRDGDARPPCRPAVGSTRSVARRPNLVVRLGRELLRMSPHRSKEGRVVATLSRRQVAERDAAGLTLGRRAAPWFCSKFRQPRACRLGKEPGELPVRLARNVGSFGWLVWSS